MGWFAGRARALNPLVQGLRPISPIAWIPLAILWFGVGDLSPIFLIFLSSFFPMVVGTAAGVMTIDRQVPPRGAELRAHAASGCSGSVILPAALPQIVTGMRIGLGVAWLVVVAAEMIAVQLRARVPDHRLPERGQSLRPRGGRHGRHRRHRVRPRRASCAGSSGSTRSAGAMRPDRDDRQDRRARGLQDVSHARRPGAGARSAQLLGRRRRVRRRHRTVGCGKSTLLGVLAGFERAGRGRGARRRRSRCRGPRRTGIFIFQQPSLFPWLDLERQSRVWPRRRAGDGPARPRRALHRAGRPRGIRARVPAPALGRHAAAGRARARADGQAGDPLHGRAVRRARRADAAADAGRAPAHPLARAPHGDPGHARRGGSAPARRPRARAVAPAREDPGRHRRDAHAPALARERGHARAEGVDPPRARRGRRRTGARPDDAVASSLGVLGLALAERGVRRPRDGRCELQERRLRAAATGARLHAAVRRR